jgi:predicted N-acetyltransferase YhbS
MDIKTISIENRQQINDFIASQWFSTDIVVRGEIVDMTTMDGFVMYDNGSIIGLVTYSFIENECEIMSLDSLREKQGIGTALVNKVTEAAIKKNAQK